MLAADARSSGASITSRRTAHDSRSRSRSRPRYSTPSQVLSPIAMRVVSWASHASSKRAATTRAEPRIADGRGIASRTRTSSVIAHASPSPKPMSWRPATSAPGTRSSSYQARLVAATSAPGARPPAGLRVSHASSVARSRRPSPWRRLGAPSSSGSASASGSLKSAAAAAKPASSAETAIPTKARSALARIRFAIAAASPSTPVASATAERKATTRRSSSSS